MLSRNHNLYVVLLAYRQWLLLLFILRLGDVQSIYETLQLLPKGFHLSIDTIQQLMLSDPEEQM